MEKSEIITISQACDILNCHPNTLRKWDNNGLLEAIRFGTRGDRRYKRSDILKLIDIEDNNTGAAGINDVYKLQNRRYIGNKYKLTEWIFSTLEKENITGDSFFDVFAGTGVVAAQASQYYNKIIVNDFLYSNHAIFQAFFGSDYWDRNKIRDIVRSYNTLNGRTLKENYFSKHFGGKYFGNYSSRVIGHIREDIENNNNLNDHEYYILIASLLYSVDKVANTVGHYDAYFRKNKAQDNFLLKVISPLNVKNASIFREDSNLLAKKIAADVVYIDPPYNSRQYSRFYHLLENLTKWDEPELFGTALKPAPENISCYCKVEAKDKLAELVNDLKAKYLVVSYNNTYESKSNSSKNKITLNEIKNILKGRGKTKVFEKNYRHFNAGNTNFNNHKEYLFVTKTSYANKN